MAHRRNRARFDFGDEDDAPETPELDLHGRSVEAATRAVSEALARSRAGGAETLVLVTGKGHGSAGGASVLKPSLKRWLLGPEGRRLGAGRIREIHGGGALEVSIVRRDRG